MLLRDTRTSFLLEFPIQAQHRPFQHFTLCADPSPLFSHSCKNMGVGVRRTFQGARIPQVTQFQGHRQKGNESPRRFAVLKMQPNCAAKSRNRGSLDTHSPRRYCSRSAQSHSSGGVMTPTPTNTVAITTMKRSLLVSAVLAIVTLLPAARPARVSCVAAPDASAETSQFHIIQP